VDLARVRPLDDGEFKAHIDEVAAGLDAAKERGLETKSLYTVDPERRVWDFDRAEKQNEIIAHLYREKADAPCDGQAVMAGGLGGAGKGTVLGGYAGIDRSRYLTLDPDRVKEEMAAPGDDPRSGWPVPDGVLAAGSRGVIPGDPGSRAACLR